MPGRSVGSREVDVLDRENFLDPFQDVKSSIHCLLCRSIRSPRYSPWRGCSWSLGLSNPKISDVGWDSHLPCHLLLWLWCLLLLLLFTPPPRLSFSSRSWILGKRSQWMFPASWKLQNIISLPSTIQIITTKSWVMTTKTKLPKILMVTLNPLQSLSEKDE